MQHKLHILTSLCTMTLTSFNLCWKFVGLLTVEQSLPSFILVLSLVNSGSNQMINMQAAKNNIMCNEYLQVVAGSILIY